MLNVNRKATAYSKQDIRLSECNGFRQQRTRTDGTVRNRATIKLLPPLEASSARGLFCKCPPPEVNSSLRPDDGERIIRFALYFSCLNKT